jgi:hypothetical protein
MVRDYEAWMHKDVRERVEMMIEDRWTELKDTARAKKGAEPKRPTQVGLCVSIYKPDPAGRVGVPVDNILYIYSILVAMLQLGVAAIPYGIVGDWSVLMITACGILLSIVTASLPQWKREKWACRHLPEDGENKVILTRGNGSQHAIVILGQAGFLDLEDLAGGQNNVDVSTSTAMRGIVVALAFS